MRSHSSETGNAEGGCPTADELRALYARGLSNPEIAALYRVAINRPSKWSIRLGVKNPRHPGQCKCRKDNLGIEGRRRGWEKSMRLMGLLP